MDGAHRLLLINERIRELHGIAAGERLARSVGAAAPSPSAAHDRPSPTAIIVAVTRRLLRGPLSA